MQNFHQLMAGTLVRAQPKVHAVAPHDTPCMEPSCTLKKKGNKSRDRNGVRWHEHEDGFMCHKHHLLWLYAQSTKVQEV